MNRSTFLDCKNLQLSFLNYLNGRSLLSDKSVSYKKTCILCIRPPFTVMCIQESFSSIQYSFPPVSYPFFTTTSRDGPVILWLHNDHLSIFASKSGKMCFQYSLFMCIGITLCNFGCLIIAAKGIPLNRCTIYTWLTELLMWLKFICDSVLSVLFPLWMSSIVCKILNTMAVVMPKETNYNTRLGNGL